MYTTRTGGFPIGFRRGWSDWQQNLDGLIQWSTENGMAVVDLGGDADVIGQKVVDAGLKIGTADLPSWSGLITSDAGKRQETVEKMAAYVAATAPLGVRNYFIVMLPEDPSKSRKENHALMIEGLGLLTPHLEKYGARLAIEGWPGPGALCCTPESYRAAIRDSGSKSVGINYDPSHLIRMGIDPIRFVQEFAPHVAHVHGKDTEVMSERIYEFGTEQGPTLASNYGFGGAFWRYTIPGHGQTRWTEAFRILAEAGYDGAVCIELEDENFNGTEEGEKRGLVAGASYLASA